VRVDGGRDRAGLGGGFVGLCRGWVVPENGRGEDGQSDEDCRAGGRDGVESSGECGAGGVE
jgi:hypothetical protein